MNSMKFVDIIAAKNKNYTTSQTPLISFLGDSITHGVFEVYPGETFHLVVDHEAVYHAKLKRKLQHLFPNAPLTVHNAGISGDTAQGGAVRLERDVLRYRPDLVVVCFGLNDSGQKEKGLSSYRDGLRGIFTSLREAGIETIFMTPNMKNTYVHPLTQGDLLKEIAAKCADEQNGGIMDLYIDSARQVCLEEGVRLCDVYQKWITLQKIGVDTTSLLSNYINHPTREMHDLFAEALLDSILFQQ